VACGCAIRDLVRTVGAEVATGEVIALYTEGGSKGTMYRPTVRFPTEGGPVTITVGSWLLFFWNCLAVPAAATETPSRCEICQGQNACV
jgi:hypothetical protein